MEEQPVATVSVATGALGPVLEKLAALLGDEQHRSRLGAGTCSEIESIRSMLASMHSLLLRIWERDDVAAECKEWMSRARGLSYDMEDDIDDLMVSFERCDDAVGHGELNRLFRYLKMRVEAVSWRCREEWKTTTAAPDEAISISNKRSKPSPVDPRARFLHKDVSELVGMEGPFFELQCLLEGHEMVCIHGFAGTGKTALADMVYQEFGNRFKCRAFVSLSKSPDMMEVLGGILTQVTEGVHPVETTCTEATSEENLIHDISKFLSGKRYLVIVDDIWLWQSWQIIRRALPMGNRLGGILATTRVHAIADKCLTEEGAAIYRHNGISPQAAYKLSGRILGHEVNTLRRNSLRTYDLIVNMCGGMTLAVSCLLSAAAESIYKWQLEGDNESLLQKLWHVLLDGLLCNKPELRSMVESLRLGYDDLPVHLKTCLLYCSILPTGYNIERHGLVRQWITQGFFPQGPIQEKEAAAEACLDELVSRALLQQELTSSAGEKKSYYCSVHPIMRAFLSWRSKEANFATCLELRPHNYPPSYASAAGGPPFVGFDAEPDTISTLLVADGPSGPRSLVVFGYSGSSSMWWTTLPWHQLKHVRVLSIEDNRVPLSDPNVVVICTDMVRLRHLGLKGMPIRVLPPEIGRLHHLETLDVSGTGVRELPKQIGKLHQLKTLDVSGTGVRELPKEIGELLQLETLDVSGSGVRELPKQIGKLHHLKTLNVTGIVAELPWLSSGTVSVLADGKEVKLPLGVSAVLQSSSPIKPEEDVSIVLYVRPCEPLPVPGLRVGSRHIKVPEWIKQHLADISFLDIRLCKLEQDDFEFLSTMPNLQFLTLRLLQLPREPTVLTGTRFSRVESFYFDGRRGYMRVPGWVKHYMANVSSLDIRLCQLMDDDLDFLCNGMPNLQLLTLRLEVLPKKPIVIIGAGFLSLKSFCLDCRLPMVTFQQGAMPKLEHVEFKFYTGRILTIEDPVGIWHLLSLKRVVFQSSPMYKSDAPGISLFMNKVREEAKEHPNKITISINGKDEEVIQEKKATTTKSESDKISEGNNVTSGGAGGSSGASMIKPSHPFPYDDEKESIIPVKSYYPFGVTK